MVTKQKIGKIQFYIGIILLLITIIGSFFIVKNVYFGTLINGVLKATAAWGDVGREINGTSIGIIGHVISNNILQSQIIKTSLALFGACVLILITLSVMMILQGLANQSKK